ncbi:MAG: hypothetical protein CVU77_02080 [Elusimicrobia bacterium HGW-Elusimicrobia-1]|nr:MAG: hypothetical protein CVU77_02080 [Elusimicrobia bacterium HGW-Elusimicrobia-1]
MKDLALKRRKDIRLKNYDYKTNGYYFVTVVTRDRLPLLKEYSSDIGAVAVARAINDLPEFFNGLAVDYYVVMDDHIHIIFAFNDCGKTLGQVVKAMKYNITKIVAAGLPSRHSKGPHSNAAATKANDIAVATKTMWQWNYYEHIIRDEKKLAKNQELCRQ